MLKFFFHQFMNAPCRGWPHSRSLPAVNLAANFFELAGCAVLKPLYASFLYKAKLNLPDCRRSALRAAAAELYARSLVYCPPLKTDQLCALRASADVV
jgi:hypothetical protein